MSDIKVVEMKQKTKEELVERFKEMLREMPQYSIYDITLEGTTVAGKDDSITIIDKYHREVVEEMNGSYSVEDEEHNRLENHQQAVHHK